MKYALYIGRWQPFHNGHAAIIQKALDAGKNVCIAIRDTELSPNDPYDAADRMFMIEEAYWELVKSGRVRVIIIPDIEGVYYGRGVGYAVVQYEMPDDVEGISATEIRRLREAGDDSWKSMVPGLYSATAAGPRNEVSTIGSVWTLIISHTRITNTCPANPSTRQSTRGLKSPIRTLTPGRTRWAATRIAT